MAWTGAKAQLLGQLFRERILVEQNNVLFERWGLTGSWANILNTHVPNDAKQLILNDFIADKVIYLDNESNAASASITQLQDEIVDLNSNVE